MHDPLRYSNVSCFSDNSDGSECDEREFDLSFSVSPQFMIISTNNALLNEDLAK